MNLIVPGVFLGYAILLSLGFLCERLKTEDLPILGHVGYLGGDGIRNPRNLTTGLERYNLFGRVEYEFNEHAVLSFEGTYAHIKNEWQQEAGRIQRVDHEIYLHPVLYQAG